MDIFTFILEIIGTVAFASSGAMIAIEKKMDIFGVNILSDNIYHRYCWISFRFYDRKSIC